MDPAQQRYELIDLWRSRARRALYAYNYSVNRAHHQHQAIGGGAALLSALTGTSAVYALRQGSSEVGLAATAALGLLSAGLTALSSFGGFQRRADEYARAARRFGAARRALEDALANFDEFDAEQQRSEVERLRAVLDEASVDVPNANPSAWARAEREDRGGTTRVERAAHWVRGVR